MSKTMAAVLAEHGEWRYTNGAGSAIVCRSCGAPIETSIIEHQAAALSAAGFGLVADTKAEALREAADVLAKVGRDIDPWGKPTRENYADWLRTRAANLRDPS